MQLTFDSIQELEQFVLFAGHLGKQFAAAEHAFEAAARTQNTSVSINASLTPDSGIQASGELIARQDSSEAPIVQDDVEAPQEAAVAKRKRRTKAEMAEDTLTARSGPIAIAPQSDVTEAVSQLSADEVMHPQSSEEFGVRVRAAELLTQPEAINSIAHLRACQDFIKRFGLPEYSKGFSDSFGLNSNVMAYEDTDRARHLAVLEYLESRLAGTAAD